jgi:hypothetical protein
VKAPAKTRADRAAPRRLTVYSGLQRLGRIEIDESGSARVFDASGRKLGTFSDIKAASRAFDTASIQGNS